MNRSVPGGSWIKGFQFWMQESEAPNSYLLWAAISALAGCTQRKVSVKWGYHKYYTNHYIILVGPAGIVHKSSTIGMIKKMYHEIKIPIGSESLTREALIDQMIKRGDGITAALCAMPDEISDFIRPSGPTMIEFLTSIYDSPDVWEYTTRLRGTEEMTNAFLNLFAGTTPRWIANEFDITFVEQGFASRTLFVHALEPRFRKAKMVITPEMYKMYKLLVDDLAHISQLNTEFIWEKDAEDWFDQWYEQVAPKEMQKAEYKIKSYMARKPTHIIKLAMVLQLDKSDEPVLSLENMKEAKILLDNLEVSMSKTFSAVGRNVYANDLERIYAEIKDAGHMSHGEITAKNYGAMPKMALDETLETLTIMGKIRKVSDGKNMFYEAVD